MKKEYRITVKTVNGKFFDLFDQNSSIFICDYSRLNRELIIGGNTISEVGGEYRKAMLSSIGALKSTFAEFIPAVIQELNEAFVLEMVGSSAVLEYPDSRSAAKDLELLDVMYTLTGFHSVGLSAHFDFAVTEAEKKLLVEQLVFDTLFDKYLDESALMTRNGYSAEMSQLLYDDNIQRMACARAINENLTRGMKDNHNRMKYSQLRNQLEMLGIDPDKYDSYYNPAIKDNPVRKKPKFVWDWFYFNYGRNLKSTVYGEESGYGQGMISSRQFRRQLTRDGRNYSYKDFFNGLKLHNAFVDRLLPAENKTAEKYFHMSMDYYILESYKRIDFISKLISSLPQIKIDDINKDHFLVKRFHPMVLVPYVENGELCLATKHNYYRPLFIMENELLKDMQQEAGLDAGSDDSIYSTRLLKYQIIRAKAYELFKYHAEFNSTNYAEIKDFLCQCYDMRLYHKSNALLQRISSCDWEELGREDRRQLEEFTQNFISVNNALFWKAPDRDYAKPKSE